MNANIPLDVPLPEEDRSDKLMRLGKALAGEMPGVGFVAEFIATFIQSPYEKRQKEWLEYVHNSLKRLEAADAEFNAENAFQNDAFFTTFIAATDAAVRTHHRKKRDALRNGLLNAALPETPYIDEELQQIFIRFIRDLGPTHLGLLQFFGSPMASLSKEEFETLLDKGMAWASNPSVVGNGLPDPQQTLSRAIGYTTAHIFRTRFPDLLLQKGFVAAIVNDLRAMGLVQGEWPSGMISEIQLTVTDLGRMFLAFIKSPLPEENAPAESLSNVNGP